MGTKERREREKDATREKIMDAARRLFVTEGYEAVSMRRIADAIEYSPTAIYVHFKDKDALFQEMCSEDFSQLAHVFNELECVSDPIDRIRRIGLAYIEFAVKYPEHYRMMFMTPHKHAGELPPDVAARKGEPSEDAYAFLRQAVVEGLSEERFRDGLKNPDLIAQILWSHVHGVASLQIVKCEDPWLAWAPLQTRARLCVDSTLRGLTVDDAIPATASRSANRKGGAR